MRISEVAIDRPVFSSMVGIAVLVMGGLAFYRLGVDLFPDISFPLVSITATYPGAGPEEVEAQVTRPIEEAVASINGVDEVRSYSRGSLSQIIVTFKLEADIRQCNSDVRDHIAAIRATLPHDMLDPVISRIDPTAMGVAMYSVAAKRSSLETRKLVEDLIQKQLESVDGVGSIVVDGGAVREIRVELNRRGLDADGVSVAQLATALRGQGFDLPGGRINLGTREIMVKTRGEFRTPSEIGEVPVLALPNGAILRVKDVATIIDGNKEVRTETRVDGIDAVTFTVQKQAGTNTVAVVDSVDAALTRIKTRLPADMQIAKVVDTSAYIRTNIDHLKQELLVGAMLAVLVIFIFMLDWRSTAISAVALPTSVIASFFAMWMLGFTLNIMTMMALTLSIGMLIDDSVVVRENIFRRMERGEDPMTAARKGVSEIALAVLATSMTIVAVFVPVAFTGGLIGKMFRQFGLTVVAAVIASLLVSLTLDPMMSARFTRKLDAGHHERMQRHPIFGPATRAYEALDELYRDILKWALNRQKTVVALAALLFFGSFGLLPLMGTEFFPRSDQGEFVVAVQLPAGTSLAETDRLTKEVERVARELPEVRSLVTTVGQQEDVSQSSIRVKLTPKDQRKRTHVEVMEALRPKLAAIPGLVSNLRQPGMGGSTDTAALSAPIAIYVSGPEYGQLGELAQKVYEITSATSGTRDADISYRPGPPEQHIVVDTTTAADRGVQYATVASTIHTSLEGDVVGKYKVGEDTIDVRLQLRPQDRDSLNEIEDLSVPTLTGRPVPLREITHLESSPAPATIERLNRQRQITITANVSGRALGDVIADIQKQLDVLPKPAGYEFRFAGEAQRMAETASNMGIAMLLAVVFIYLVLASQFESLLHPFTIMLALPLAIVGAFAALFLAHQPLGMSPIIGIILLMGLVTKNGILLVDKTNHARAEGMSPIQALLTAAPTRLRPILMTSAAMVLGMLPTALSRGEGSEFRSPQAVTVIGGVITSTVLTLIVVPVVYVWVDRFTLRARRERRAAKEAGRAP